MTRQGLTIGLISDTHGLLRPEAVAALAGSDRIIHAGDVGKEAVLEELARLAPLTAIRGNVDRDAWAEALPTVAAIEIAGIRICVVHDLADLGPAPAKAGFHVVVSGHSHRPRLEEKDGVLYVNPGGAGPRRFSLPVSAGRLVIEDGRVSAELIGL